MTLLPVGVHRGIPAELYHRRHLGEASKSGLDQIERSPAHYKAWVEGQREHTSSAFQFGTALHASLLEPKRFRETYVVEPDFGDCRYKENKALRDEWRAENRGSVVISSADMLAIEGITGSVMAHDRARPLLTAGDSEVTIAWVDEATGVRCKARIDRLVQHGDSWIAVDAKTTEDAGPEQFARSAARYGYHHQAAFYLRGLQALGVSCSLFAFAAMEKEAPFAVAVYVLEEEALAHANACIDRALSRMARCLSSGEWPAYPREVQSLALPRWALGGAAW